MNNIINIIKLIVSLEHFNSWNKIITLLTVTILVSPPQGHVNGHNNQVII